MTITLSDETVTEATPTMELRWELQNPEGVRPRRWRLMQKHIVNVYHLIAPNGRCEKISQMEEWRPIPVVMPTDEIIAYSRAHAGFVPQALDLEGELK